MVVIISIFFSNWNSILSTWKLHHKEILIKCSILTTSCYCLRIRYDLMSLHFMYFFPGNFTPHFDFFSRIYLVGSHLRPLAVSFLFDGRICSVVAKCSTRRHPGILYFTSFSLFGVDINQKAKERKRCRSIFLTW